MDAWSLRCDFRSEDGECTTWCRRSKKRKVLADMGAAARRALACHHGYGQQPPAASWHRAAMIRTSAIVVGILLSAAAGGGEALYYPCKSCHGEKALGNEALGAPAIAGMEPGYLATQMKHFRDGVRGNSLTDLYGRQMSLIAALFHDDEDIEALATYIAAMPRSKPLVTLRRPGAGSAALYAPCTVCHGRNGAGMALPGAPAIAWLDDWYLLRQLRNFRDGIRGSDPRDTGGTQMREAVTGLSDDELRQLTFHITTLSGDPAEDSRAQTSIEPE